MSLQKALALVNEAVEADGAGQYAKAAPLYSKAISELELSCKLESNEDTKRMISDKINEYKNRLRQITLEADWEFFPTASSAQPTAATSAAGSTAMAMSSAVPPTQLSYSSGFGAASQPGAVSGQGSYQQGVVMPGTTREDTRVMAELSLKPPTAMGGSEAWQTAIELVERGKTEDSARNFARALELYQCSMSYFLRAIHSEDVLTTDMKAKAREQMKTFLTRAEQLKAYLDRQVLQSGQQPGQQQPQQQQQQCSSAVETAVAGVCTACGKPMQTSLYALDREWHVECFIAKVRCAFCDKPFSALDLRFVVGKENGLPYHVRCHDFTTGLSRSVEKSFFGHDGKVFLKVSLQKRLFHIGDSIEIEFVYDNETSVKMNVVQIGLLVEEGRSSRTANFERVENVTKKVVSRADTLLGALPMAVGRFSAVHSFAIPPALQPTVVNDHAMRREYTLKIKAIMGGIWPSLDIEFPITIGEC